MILTDENRENEIIYGIDINQIETITKTDTQVKLKQRYPKGR